MDKKQTNLKRRKKNIIVYAIQSDSKLINRIYERISSVVIFACSLSMGVRLTVEKRPRNPVNKKKKVIQN